MEGMREGKLYFILLKLFKCLKGPLWQSTSTNFVGDCLSFEVLSLIMLFFFDFFFLQAKKGKKSAKKATLAGTSAKAGRKDDLDAFGGGNYDYGDEFDDFM